MTRLLLTRIPYFREIVLSSFYCPHCSFKNTEISSAGQIQERGSKYVFKVENTDDFQRSVVKGDGCAFRVEDIDLEIPQGRGQMTNIEGILAGVKEDLSQHQEARMQQMPEAGAKVAEVIQALGDMLDGKRYPFTVSAEDPSGNSFIQPSPTDARHKYTRTEFDRTPEQNAFLGIGEEAPADDGQQAPETNIRPEYRAADGLVGGGATDAPRTVTTNNVDEEDIRENEVYSFPAKPKVKGKAVKAVVAPYPPSDHEEEAPEPPLVDDDEESEADHISEAEEDSEEESPKPKAKAKSKAKPEPKSKAKPKVKAATPKPAAATPKPTPPEAETPKPAIAEAPTPAAIATPKVATVKKDAMSSAKPSWQQSTYRVGLSKTQRIPSLLKVFKK